MAQFKQNYEKLHSCCGTQPKDKERKVQYSFILLDLAGEDAVQRYNSFTFEEGEDRDDPDVLIKQKFEELCMPLKNLTFERHLFHTRKQGRSEPINSFVTDMKNIARKCEFFYLERDLIKDCIVCGIQSDAVRKILFRETSLTLEKALSLCELSEQQVKNLVENEDVDGVRLRSHESQQDKRRKGQPKKLGKKLAICARS